MAKTYTKFDIYKNAVDRCYKEIGAEGFDFFSCDTCEEGTLEGLLIKSLNTSYETIYKLRSAIKRYDSVKDQKKRICSDNAHLANQLIRLRETVTETKKTLNNLTAALKHEKSENNRLHRILQSSVKEPSDSSMKNVNGRIHRKNFTCNECGKRLSSHGFLQLHMRNHRIDKTIREFRCKMCERSFAKSANLARHLLSHRNKK